MRKLIIICCLLLTFDCFSKIDTTTFDVKVIVRESNTVSSTEKNQETIKKNLSNTTSTVIEKQDMSCCYCTKQYDNGTYIDENHTAYLFDRKTNTFAINNLNKDKGYAIACPGIDWGKSKKNFNYK
jgi:hypothetical protein